MKQALKDLKVIELATVLAGPSVGMYFAELGARVIKVEHPNNPDVTRSWKLPGESGEISAYFSSVNYGKSYLPLDLTKPADRTELDVLLTDADILLTNFKHGGAAKFKLDFDRLHARFPQLIVGQISGFKSTPKRTAFDVVVQAETGWMHMNGTPQSGPVKMPVALMDVLAAHHLKEGLLLALLERVKTGQGKFVEVSLEEAGIASLTNQASNYLMTGHIPQPIGSRHPNIAPYGDTFSCADDKALVLAIGNTPQFNKLIALLGADLPRAQNQFDTNQKRVQHRAALVSFLAPYFKNFARDTLLDALIEQGVPAGAVRPMNEVFDNPVAQDMVLRETINGQETLRLKTALNGETGED
jgi:crotonobetainyl-CoA:carnitine CoA-transferase CaiB-like acyl-CoA transferase